jgi:hypothetical protein
MSGVFGLLKPGDVVGEFEVIEPLAEGWAPYSSRGSRSRSRPSACASFRPSRTRTASR